ncbi:protein of unknown function [Fontimonas thermophila]|uniref:DUF4404 family protein n=1 Tax=Fontimonas thermophila TaxID=1076937 RepID=A0A1I2KFE6_9GAMM|nr:DUF4404 family protein [Fontimonas thermophila]SFF64950.1 protein of unknown function [Fontimonas thermophila]
MDRQRLHQDLTELRQELEGLPTDAEARQRLLALIRRIETRLDVPSAAESRESLVGGIDEAIAEFEVEHPRAALLLQRIVHTLSSMGI